MNRKKKTASVEFGTMCSFRRPLGVLERIPQIRGDDCTFNMLSWGFVCTLVLQKSCSRSYALRHLRRRFFFFQRIKQDRAFLNRLLSILGSKMYFECYDFCQDYGRRSKMCVLESPTNLFCQIAFILSVLRKLSLGRAVSHWRHRRSHSLSCGTGSRWAWTQLVCVLVATQPSFMSCPGAKGEEFCVNFLMSF